MKMMIILAVLFASLLVVTGVAFAITDCCEDACYKLTYNDLTFPANSGTTEVSFCFESGWACIGDTPFLEFSFFGTRAIGFGLGPGAYVTFHGLNWTSFDGLLLDTDQYTIHGVKEECTG